MLKLTAYLNRGHLKDAIQAEGVRSRRALAVIGAIPISTANRESRAHASRSGDRPRSQAVLTLVELDQRGVAWISGTKTKVIEVALDKVAYGWSPEEIHFQHNYLSIAQIHAALAYYHEHQAQFDGEMKDLARRAQEWAEAGSDSPGRERLRRLG